MAGFLFLVSDPGVVFEDFRKAYYVAGKASLVSGDAIAELFKDGVFGFVNLPIMAYAFAPFALLPERAAGFVYSAIAGAALFSSWLLVSRELAFSRAQQALSLFALAAFGPLIHSLRQANTTHLTLAATLWSVILLKRGHPMISGVILGVAAIVKPPLALFGIYFLLRRYWLAAATMALTGLSVIAGSLLILGLGPHLAWYDACIRPFSSGVVAAFNAQSIPAFFARFELGNDVLWDWSTHQVSSVARVQQYVASLSLIGLAIWAAVKTKKRELLFESSLVLALAFLLSPLSWSHYGVWLLPAMALLWVRTSRGSYGWQSQAALVAVFALTAPAQFLSAPMREGVYPMSLLLTSHLVLGGVLIVCLLAFLTRSPVAGRPSAHPI